MTMIFAISPYLILRRGSLRAGSTLTTLLWLRFSQVNSRANLAMDQAVKVHTFLCTDKRRCAKTFQQTSHQLSLRSHPIGKALLRKQTIFTSSKEQLILNLKTRSRSFCNIRAYSLSTLILTSSDTWMTPMSTIKVSRSSWTWMTQSKQCRIKF